VLDNLIDLTGLPTQSFAIAAIAVFAAGLIRGFSGFGLSAILMASIVTIIPPVELIPICYVLEGAASVAMFRGGLKNADMTVVWGLVIGSAIGAITFAILKKKPGLDAGSLPTHPIVPEAILPAIPGRSVGATAKSR